MKSLSCELYIFFYLKTQQYSLLSIKRVCEAHIFIRDVLYGHKFLCLLNCFKTRINMTYKPN